jgi:replication-associated recombination protein RarA
MEKLNFFLKENKIPNIIFHGPIGSGKKTLLNQFIQKIYPDKQVLKEQVMQVNCAFGKGIKFIRDDIKYFSKINTHCEFKSIILLNAEKLTSDAQFALRRCIEEFSNNTRYFIVTTDKYKLIKPILSRFSEIYIYSPINYYSLQLNKLPFDDYEKERKENLFILMKTLTPDTIKEVSQTLFDQAYSGLDIEMYVTETEVDMEKKYSWLLYYSIVRVEVTNECLLMYILLHYFLFRKEMPLNLFV